MCCVREDKEDADACCDQTEGGGEEEAEVVIGEAFPQRLFVYDLLGECAVAFCHCRSSPCFMRRGAIFSRGMLSGAKEVVSRVYAPIRTTCE